MADDLSIARQRERDAEYLRACKAHGIEPELPRYDSHLLSVSDEIIDAALNDGAGAKNGHSYRTRGHEPEPLRELPPEAEAAARVLDLLCPHRADCKLFVATAGCGALVLAWLLGRRPEPLAEMARQIGITRASLSTFARRINDRFGLTGRGQKGASTRATYRETAKRSWKLRRLNTMLKDAVAGE